MCARACAGVCVWKTLLLLLPLLLYDGAWMGGCLRKGIYAVARHLASALRHGNL